jgi:hypothetical protein
MSSLAVHGVPIPPEEIHAALRSVAIPGYTGTLQLSLTVSPEAARFVTIAIVRRQSQTQESTREEIPVTGEHLRKKSVQKVMDDLRGRLYLRPILMGIEAHYVDGELKKFTIIE